MPESTRHDLAAFHGSHTCALLVNMDRTKAFLLNKPFAAKIDYAVNATGSPGKWELRYQSDPNPPR
jgi:hypothetical protein